MECLRGILQRERYVFSQARACPADQALYTRRNIWRAQWNRDMLPLKKKRKLYLTA